MSNASPTRDSRTLDESTISNMWEITASVEVLERKGLFTKQDRYDVSGEFRRKNPLFELGREVFREWYSHLGRHDRIRRREPDKAREALWGDCNCVSRSRGAAGWRAGATTGDHGQRRGANGVGVGGGIYEGGQRGCGGKAR